MDKELMSMTSKLGQACEFCCCPEKYSGNMIKQRMTAWVLKCSDLKCLLDNIAEKSTVKLSMISLGD